VSELKKIAITQRLILNDSYYEIRDSLDIRWGELFAEIGFLPVIIPTNYDFEKYFENGLGFDGIILSSGNDLNNFNPNSLSEKRDTFEKKLISFAISKKIPILGVCRGMHIIGDLFNAGFEIRESHIAKRHKVLASQDSQYFNELNKLQEVNSYHKYCINKISNEFLISAISEDGAIEAIEHKKFKIFAQMWHSERENPFNTNELELIKKIFD
jgi:gamma-glutamyl-gamma-aminobutyrate hydrolase PuuD